VPYLNVNFKLLLVVITVGMSIVNGVMAFSIIFTRGVGKNGSTVAVSGFSLAM